MTRLALILALAGCAVPQADICHASAAGLNRYCGGEMRSVDVRPEPEPEPEEVCDGGARKCGDGEQPTGTVDDPTGYL